MFAAATVAFAPLNEATAVTTETPVITVTFSAAMRNLDDTAITDVMLPDKISFKETDASGDDVPCTMSINAGKTVITIVPTVDLTSEQDYYVAVLADSFENASNEVTVATAATWTTDDAATLTGTVSLPNSITTKALVAGGLGGNKFTYLSRDDETIIIAYNSSEDTAYDLTVNAPVNPNYAGIGIADLVKSIPFGEIALINIESARYADKTGIINLVVDNAAIKFAVFYTK